MADGRRPPAWLALSPLARRAWRDIEPILRQLRVLTEADAVALALLCDALAGYVTAKKTAAAEGSIYWTTGKVRMRRAHPAVAMASDFSRFAKVMLGEFGLTPAARSKVSAADPDTKDPLHQWIEGSG
jgi:P27 family predicted phage terminase small subunit